LIFNGKNTALYDIEKRNDGWAIIDVRLDVAAISNGVTISGMDTEDADNMADFLTLRE
jgi:hypothetical protein